MKLMYIDVKKAHLNGILEDSDFAYIMLPKEVGGSRSTATVPLRYEACRIRVGR